MNLLIARVIGENHLEADRTDPEERQEVALARSVLAHLERNDTEAAKESARSIISMHQGSHETC